MPDRELRREIAMQVRHSLMEDVTALGVFLGEVDATEHVATFGIAGPFGSFVVQVSATEEHSPVDSPHPLEG